MKDVFSKIIKVSVYSLIFLLPLFFLPFSFEAFEFNKQYLLFFLVLLALLAWLAKMVISDKEIRFRKTPLDLPVLAFLGIAIFSAIFSVDKISSIFGFYGKFSDGLIVLLSLGILYFLITNNTQPNSKIKPGILTISGILKAFLWSSAGVVVLNYFAILGIWQKLQSLISEKGQSLPPVMIQTTFNPISGSMEGLAVFLAMVIVLLVGLLLRTSPEKPRKLGTVSFSLLLLASLFLLVVTDFSGAWLIMLVTLTFFTAFILFTRILREEVNKLLLPIFLIIIAAGFLVVNPSQFLPPDLLPPISKELILGQGESWKIGFKAITENIKSIFLGSGIGTFHYDFSKFKSTDFNQNWFWQIRFDRAGNYFAEVIATMGIFGFLSYLALIGLFLLISWMLLISFVGPKAKTTVPEKNILELYTIPLLMAFVALLVSQLVYYQNITLAFAFWLILAIGVISWQKPISEKVISFKNFPELSLIFSTVTIIFGLAVAGFYFLAVKFYLADAAYLDGMRAIDQSALISNLEKAINLNPHQPQYKIVLARTYLNRALLEMGKPAKEQDQTKLSNDIFWAVTYVKGGRVGQIYIPGAVEIAPNRVSAWETLGMVYRDIRLVTEGAREWGIKAFEKATELEPTNPVFYTEIGKLYVEKNELPKAKELFEKAKELKSDYIDARLQLVLLDERENNLEEAVKKLESLAQDFPLNIEIAFQLGRLYYNTEKIDQAISQLESLVRIFPNHSNARYVLGLAYQKKGEIDQAIAQFEKVLEMNPENQDVISKLEELKKLKKEE